LKRGCRGQWALTGPLVQIAVRNLLPTLAALAMVAPDFASGQVDSTARLLFKSDFENSSLAPVPSNLHFNTYQHFTRRIILPGPRKWRTVFPSSSAQVELHEIATASGDTLEPINNYILNTIETVTGPAENAIQALKM